MKEINFHLSEMNIWDYIDNPISFSHYEEHLSSCANCQNLLKECRAVKTELNLLESFEPSDQFTSRVVSKVITAKTIFPWFFWIMSACILVVSVIIVYSLIRNNVSIDFHPTIFYTLIITIVVLCFWSIESIINFSSIERLKSTAK